MSLYLGLQSSGVPELQYDPAASLDGCPLVLCNLCLCVDDVLQSNRVPGLQYDPRASLNGCPSVFLT